MTVSNGSNLLKNPVANIEVESTAALQVVEQISPSKDSAFATVRRLSSFLPIADRYFSEVFQHNRRLPPIKKAMPTSAFQSIPAGLCPKLH